MFSFKFSVLAAGATILIAGSLFFYNPLMAQDQDVQSVKGYPEGVLDIRYQSAADDSPQPALFWKPDERGETPKRPLLVALHTWSSDYLQAGGEAKYAEWCQTAGWVFIHPNFRGPNKTPEALGSELAVADILSAVDYARKNANIDESRIYCIGVSGGGHASLLMAGRAPELWAGVSAWCGISDIAAWHDQCSGTQQDGYARQIEGALGGVPDTAERRADAQQRSPLTWLPRAAGVNLDISHGIHDGRDGSVPFSQSLHAWNTVIDKTHPDAALSDEAIDEFYDSQKSPDPAPDSDPLYPDDQQPLFRRSADNTRVTIFEGGHEILHEAALNWLAAQRKGQPAKWQVERTHSLKVDAADKESGK